MALFDTDSPEHVRSRRAGPGGMAREARAAKLFIGGLTRSTTTKQLRDHFSQYGRVLDCVAMRQTDGRPRGFGYVTLDSTLAADRCLAEPQVIDGRTVDIKRAVPGPGGASPPGAPPPRPGAPYAAAGAAGALASLLPPCSWTGGAVGGGGIGFPCSPVSPPSVAPLAAWPSSWAGSPHGGGEVLDCIEVLRRGSPGGSSPSGLRRGGYGGVGGGDMYTGGLKVFDDFAPPSPDPAAAARAVGALGRTPPMVTPTRYGASPLTPGGPMQTPLRSSALRFNSAAGLSTRPSEFLARAAVDSETPQKVELPGRPVRHILGDITDLMENGDGRGDLLLGTPVKAALPAPLGGAGRCSTDGAPLADSEDPLIETRMGVLSFKQVEERTRPKFAIFDDFATEEDAHRGSGGAAAGEPASFGGYPCSLPPGLSPPLQPWQDRRDTERRRGQQAPSGAVDMAIDDIAEADVM